MIATVGILAICAAGAAWIYLRDWQRPRPDAAQRATALIDAKRVFCCGDGRERCHGCRIEVLDSDGAGRWRLRVTGRAATRCFWIDPDSFQERPRGGFDGIRRTVCA